MQMELIYLTRLSRVLNVLCLARWRRPACEILTRVLEQLVAIDREIKMANHDKSLE